MKTPRKAAFRGLSGCFCVALRSRGNQQGCAVSKMYWSRGMVLNSLVFCAALAAGQDHPNQPQAPQTETLNRQFQSAVAQYNAGRFAEAAAQLEALLPYAPRTFELHELLGLVYAGQSQDAKAVEQLQI